MPSIWRDQFFAKHIDAFRCLRIYQVHPLLLLLVNRDCLVKELLKVISLVSVSSGRFSERLDIVVVPELVSFEVVPAQSFSQILSFYLALRILELFPLCG